MSMLITKKSILQKNGFKEIFGRWVKVTPVSIMIITNKELAKMNTRELKEKINGG